VKIPQFPFEQAVPDARARSFHAKARYGYVWVCLGEPADDIPDLPYEDDVTFRRIHQFDEFWRCSALRMMENSYDNAHFAFVHKGTFGDIDQPKPEKYELTETHYGFVAETIVPVRNPPQAARITGTSEPWTKRKMRNAWFMPFCRTMDMEYPSGLRHIIFNSATPVDDGSIQLIQILYRNDREEDCSTAELIAWDKAIIEEDRDILESTDPDAVVDMERKLEMHMPLGPARDADAQASERAARSARGAGGPALTGDHRRPRPTTAARGLASVTLRLHNGMTGCGGDLRCRAAPTPVR